MHTQNLKQPLADVLELGRGGGALSDQPIFIQYSVYSLYTVLTEIHTKCRIKIVCLFLAELKYCCRIDNVSDAITGNILFYSFSVQWAMCVVYMDNFSDICLQHFPFPPHKQAQVYDDASLRPELLSLPHREICGHALERQLPVD